MGRPKGSQSKGPNQGPKPVQRIRFGNYHVHLVKHPKNVYAFHLCIDINNIVGYFTGSLTMPLDTWTHFLNAGIPKVMLPRYNFVTIFRSARLFVVRCQTVSARVTRSKH